MDDEKEKFALWGDHLLKKLNNGTQQHKLYLQFLNGIVKRVKDDMDAVVAVCGERGIGKSSFGLVSGIALNKLGLDFSMDNVFYLSKEIDKAIEQIINSTSSVFVFDEMIDFAYSRNAMTTMNRNIARILTKTRKLNNVYFFCIPKFRELDSTIRNNVVNYWIEVFWRSRDKDEDRRYAMASLFKKDRNPLTDDPWGFSMEQHKKKRIFTPKDQLKLMKRIRSHVCTMAFPKLPKTIEDYYKEISIQSIKESNLFLKNIPTPKPKPKNL